MGIRKVWDQASIVETDGVTGGLGTFTDQSITLDTRVYTQAIGQELLTYTKAHSYLGVNDFRVYGTLVPEPSALVLLVCGLTGLLGYAWRKRKSIP